MNRAEIINAVHAGHLARKGGDLEGVLAAFHPDARFRLAGSAGHAFLPPVVPDQADLRTVMQALIDGFEFLELEETASVVEGLTAAVRWRAKIRHRPSGEVVDTELCDLWRFGPDGLARELVQFCDTAMMAKLAG